MVKAQLTLPNGTVVEIEGSTQEVKELLEFYGGDDGGGGSTGTRKEAANKAAAKDVAESGTLDLTDIVNQVKSCDEAADIEERILDKSSQVDRTLLPLYIVHEYFDNQHALSSGDVPKVTTLF